MYTTGSATASLDALEGVHAFLHDHVVHFRPSLVAAILLRVRGCERGDFRGVVHRHHAHAIGAGIRLDRRHTVSRRCRTRDTSSRFSSAHRRSHPASASSPVRSWKSTPSTCAKYGLMHPRIDLDHLRELLRDVVIAGEMRRFTANGPARMQRRQQILLVQIFQHGRNAARQVIVQQDRDRDRNFSGPGAAACVRAVRARASGRRTVRS